MKKLKIFMAALAALTMGALAFAADTAAADYISKFTALVASAESYAKSNDGSKAALVASQKTQIDALRQTVTLSTTQRFSDWRLGKRYDSAYAKLQSAAKASTAKTAASEKTSQAATAVGEAASSAAGTLKETGSNAVNSVKESASSAAASAKDGAKAKVDSAASDAANSVTEKIQQGAEGITNTLNNLLGGKKSE